MVADALEPVGAADPVPDFPAFWYTASLLGTQCHYLLLFVTSANLNKTIFRLFSLCFHSQTGLFCVTALEQDFRLPYSVNVTELRGPNQTAYDGLNGEQRMAFVKANYGFLQDVVDALAAARTPFSFSTVSGK
jgi:hypothetical protein